MDWVKRPAFAFAVLLVLGNTCSADTIIKKDGERVKGVVIEEYKDRVTISTFEGKKQIMRSAIDYIVYDLEEQNLASLAEKYQDMGEYKKAYYYFEKALKINPKYKKAREGLDFVSGYISRNDRAKKIKDIQRKEAIEQWRKGSAQPKGEQANKKLSNGLGISLKKKDKDIIITEVIKGSPADDAGLKKGDIIAAIWGRLTGYMDIDEVIRNLLPPGVMEMRLTIKRTITIESKNTPGAYNEIIGADLEFKKDGLTVIKLKQGGGAQMAGLKKGDIITSIQGNSVTFMSEKNIENIISTRKGDTVILGIKRDLTLWRKI